jgi:hypothetical protein
MTERPDHRPHQELAVVTGRAITVSEAARRWNVSRPTARKRLAQGLMPDLTEPVEVLRFHPPGTAPGAPGIRCHGPGSGTGRLLAGALVATAFGLGVVGLILNATFAASIGQTPRAAFALAGIGVAFDVLAMVLPVTGAALLARGRPLFAVVAWMLWPAVLVMTLLAATGFAAGNLGDGIAGRVRAVDEAADLRRDLARLRGERSNIVEQRSTGEITAAIERTRVAPWALPCTSPDSAEVRRACDPVMKLRQAQALAQRRDQLDVEVRQAEAKLEGLPAVGLADPTAFAAEIVTWSRRAGSRRPRPTSTARGFLDCSWRRASAAW